MRYRASLATLLIIALANLASAITNFQPTGHVNDFANIMTVETRQELEKSLRSYEQATSIELAVATIPSLEGITIEDYAQQLFKSWGIGKKDKDNGVLFLIAPNDRKMRIETGYGMEPDLTDLQSKAILDEQVRPLFKEGKLSEGIVTGVASILATLGNKPFHQREQERAAAAEQQRRQSEESDRQFKATASVLGVAILALASLLAIWTGIKTLIQRRRDYRHVTQENAKLLKSLPTAISEADLAYHDAMHLISKIKDEHTSNAWENLTPQGSTDSLQQELRACQYRVTSLGQANILYRKLKNLQGKVRAYTNFKAVVKKRVAEIEKAQTGSAKLLATQPDDLRLLQIAIRHPDVGEAAKKLATEAGHLLKKAQDLLEISQPCNWLELYRLLLGVAAHLDQARCEVEVNKKYALKARQEGPSLLEEIPGLISKAEQEVSHSDVSSSTKSKLTAAKEKFAQAQKVCTGNAVEWVVGFTLLTKVATLIQDALKSAESDKDEKQRRRRRSSSSGYSSSSNSSSYDSGSSGSSSSSSFGGFGGGSSGGGGASSDW